MPPRVCHLLTEGRGPMRRGRVRCRSEEVARPLRSRGCARCDGGPRRHRRSRRPTRRSLRRHRRRGPRAPCAGSSPRSLLGRSADYLTVLGMFMAPLYGKRVGNSITAPAYADLVLGLALMARGVHLLTVGHPAPDAEAPLLPARDDGPLLAPRPDQQLRQPHEPARARLRARRDRHPRLDHPGRDLRRPGGRGPTPAAPRLRVRLRRAVAQLVHGPQAQRPRPSGGRSTRTPSATPA